MDKTEIKEILDRISGTWDLQIPAVAGVEWGRVLAGASLDEAHRVIDAIGKVEAYRPTPAMFKKYLIGLRPQHERSERKRHECGTCEGNWWTAGDEFMHNGLRYAEVERCPDCVTRGIPTPARREKVVPMPAFVKAAMRQFKTQAPAEIDGTIEVIDPPAFRSAFDDEPF
jgi:hypothetical protein